MARASEDITQCYLKSILSYNPDTGIWRYLIARGGRPRGTIAGTIDPDGYNVVTIRKVHYRGGRLAWFYMTGDWPPDMVDHIDLNPGNDAWSNLRLATNGENQANQPAKARNLLGAKGVKFITASKKNPYVASIRYDGKHHHIGVYPTLEEARAAYAARAKEIFGEFARAV